MFYKQNSIRIKTMLRSVSNLNTFIDGLTQAVYLSSVFWVLVNIGMSINQMLFFMAQQTKAGKGRFIIQASTSHVMAQYIQKCSSGRGIAQSQRRLPNNTQHSRERERERDVPATSGIRICSPCKRSAADPRLRPLGHWDCSNTQYNISDY